MIAYVGSPYLRRRLTLLGTASPAVPQLLLPCHQYGQKFQQIKKFQQFSFPIYLILINNFDHCHLEKFHRSKKFQRLLGCNEQGRCLHFLTRSLSQSSLTSGQHATIEANYIYSMMWHDFSEYSLISRQDQASIYEFVTPVSIIYKSGQWSGMSSKFFRYFHSNTLA